MSEQEKPLGEQTALEELTSYLDGELDAEGRRHVEERLARDAQVREELHRLERAWDLLEQLPRATVDDLFAKTTVEMVALAAADEAKTASVDEEQRQRRHWLLTAAGTLAATLAGFVVGLSLWPDPNEQLLRDLPVIEDLDLYNQADYVDAAFLRLLDEQDFFHEDEDRGTP